MYKLVAVIVFASALACSSDVVSDDGESAVACEVDSDCAAGAECENPWCVDGECIPGSATGMPCGANGSCVESMCIEL